jgi:hypothetical protein
MAIERVFQYAPVGQPPRNVTVTFAQPTRSREGCVAEWECAVEIDGLEVDADDRPARRTYPGIDSLGAMLGAMQAIGILLGHARGLTWLGEMDLGFPAVGEPPLPQPSRLEIAARVVCSAIERGRYLPVEVATGFSIGDAIDIADQIIEAVGK